MSPIGFVILVNPHSPVAQTERLIRVLNKMFQHPPIACHFDLGKNPQLPENLLPNVKVVRPHVDTKWADFSCIEAAMRAIELLYSDNSGPDWFVYLSGADYPIKPAGKILADLRDSPCDAHIEHLLVENKIFPENATPFRPEGYKGRHWLQLCYRRFCSLRITTPWITKKLKLQKRVFWLNHPWIAAWKLPFSKQFRCYAGEAWWCANRKAAHAILDFHKQDTAFADHCRRVLVPEECYFQTVLANDPTLKLSQDYLRYIDWQALGSHPKILSISDLEPMRLSNAHFARKFPTEIDGVFQSKLEELSD